ncbi:MAG: DUF4132 domain-containing protein [Planctomycetota bacterium]|jgi:hypothetical protein
MVSFISKFLKKDIKNHSYLDEIFQPKVIQKANSYQQLMSVFGNDSYLASKDKEKYDKILTDILSEDSELHSCFILMTMYKVASLRNKYTPLSHSNINLRYETGYPAASVEVVRRLLLRKLLFEEAHILFMLNRTADLGRIASWNPPYLKSLIKITEKYLASNEVTEGIYKALERLFNALTWIANAPEKKLRERINVLRGGPRCISILPGEAWSDRALEDLHSMDNSTKRIWTLLLGKCEESDAGKPSKKWLDETNKYISEIEEDIFEKYISTWFPLVNKSRTGPPRGSHSYTSDCTHLLVESNISILKGLAWCCSQFDDKKMARCLRDLAISAFKKIPDKGPRAVRLGNACIYSLSIMGEMEALHQLAFLKIKIRFKPALKLIEKALNSAAQRLNVSRTDLEEMSVPGYGLTDVGLLEESIGDFTARMQILDGDKTELKWIKPDGKVQKSVPVSVKKDHADSLKELKATIKDIQKMIPAQKERMQNLYLLNKTWSYTVWKERYLDHPLVGTLARRLLWKFKNGDTGIDGVYDKDTLVDIDGNKLDSSLNDGTTVQLWHPIGHDVEYIIKWRKKLVEFEIKQPFKQLHREVYVLTDAERQTRIYSNRYAAHIVKQHQFNSLCGARGWKNSLKLMVDADYPPPSITLPVWNLRAEFWTDGAGDEYGQDTNETGTYLYLATDQVRFFAMDAPQSYAHSSERGQAVTTDPMPLEDIPPLVFSEVMRDVDLFVGVASVGNDPEWADAGPEGHQTYWQPYSFGDLTQRAVIRKQVLMDLVPRLAISQQCSFDGRFLRVQGKIRAYKIHLGSGNILMEPNDSYLCIVRNRTKEMKDGISKLFLPFEGDETLSVIISKALLLANDEKIKDSMILSQIKKF